VVVACPRAFGSCLPARRKPAPKPGTRCVLASAIGGELPSPGENLAFARPWPARVVGRRPLLGEIRRNLAGYAGQAHNPPRALRRESPVRRGVGDRLGYVASRVSLDPSRLPVARASTRFVRRGATLALAGPGPRGAWPGAAADRLHHARDRSRGRPNAALVWPRPWSASSSRRGGRLYSVSKKEKVPKEKKERPHELLRSSTPRRARIRRAVAQVRDRLGDELFD